MDERLTEIKESALSYLDKLETVLPNFVLELRAADIGRLAMLADVIEAAKWLLESVTAVSDADPGTDRLIEALDAIENALKTLDYTLVADVLEYEILELASDWRGILEATE